MPASHRIDLLAWLNEIDTHSANQWQIHKAQITHSLIQQDLPIKLIYHYETLDDDIKAQVPLNGSLLKQFNTPLTREEFANLPELSGVTLDQIAQPWQLKFMGKLVIFSQNPEVAIRLWWTNTLKDFELVYKKDLAEAIEASFYHWQFIDSVEVICKTPDIVLTAELPQLPKLDTAWQLFPSQQFEPVPAIIGLEMQKLLNENSFVKEHWLSHLIELAKGQIENLNTMYS